MACVSDKHMGGLSNGYNIIKRNGFVIYSQVRSLVKDVPTSYYIGTQALQLKCHDWSLKEVRHSVTMGPTIGCWKVCCLLTQ